MFTSKSVMGTSAVGYILKNQSLQYLEFCLQKKFQYET
jgi:hypothetical protein